MANGRAGCRSRTFRLPLRAAFLGRLDATKGVHVLVQALRSDTALPIQLDLFGVIQGEAGNDMPLSCGP